MESTELSREVQNGAAWFHRASGSILFAFNLAICGLIVFDKEKMGRSYRKFMLNLQIWSMLEDILLNVYAPFLQINCLVIFSDSDVARYMDLIPTLLIYCFCATQVLLSYSFCVFFRRRAIMPKGTFFCFYGWRFVLAVGLAELTEVIAIIMLYKMFSNARASSEEIPAIISWAKEKHSYLAINSDRVNFPFLIAEMIAVIVILLVICSMIAQLLHEIKYGMKNASEITRKYQYRAVISLIMQGIVPNILFVGPMFAVFGLYMHAVAVGPETAARNRTASLLSMMALNVTSLHTFAHSLTILACAPSYRRTIASLTRLILRCGNDVNKKVEPVRSAASDVSSTDQRAVMSR